MGAAKEGAVVENRTGKGAPRHQQTGRRVQTTKLTWKLDHLEGGKKVRLMFHELLKKEEKTIEFLALVT